MASETCESCGAAFECEAETGTCWCEDVALGPEALAALRARFAGCVCPACLRAVAAASA